MNFLGLTFWDLYTLYRMGGRRRLESLRLAWYYRHWTPDHTQSGMMRARMRDDQLRAERAFDETARLNR